VALLVDGIRVAEHTCVVALGITLGGTKVPLALAEGSSENATVVGDLLAGLRDRGLEVTRPLLVVLDGAKALRRAVTDVFDHPVIQRCQLHKLRNVTDRLPDAVAATVAKRMRAAYRNPTRSSPRPSWRRWPGSWTAPTPAPPRPCGKGWLRPHHRPPRRAAHPGSDLRSTNAIEPMIEICRDHTATPERWQDGQMVLGWIAAGMGETRQQFRRVNDYLHLPALRAALDATIATVTPSKEDAAA
jgi:putative transposase